MRSDRSRLEFIKKRKANRSDVEKNLIPDGIGLTEKTRSSATEEGTHVSKFVLCFTRYGS